MRSALVFCISVGGVLVDGLGFVWVVLPWGQHIYMGIYRENCTCDCLLTWQRVVKSGKYFLCSLISMYLPWIWKAHHELYSLEDGTGCDIQEIDAFAWFYDNQNWVRTSHVREILTATFKNWLILFRLYTQYSTWYTHQFIIHCPQHLYFKIR